MQRTSRLTRRLSLKAAECGSSSGDAWKECSDVTANITTDVTHAAEPFVTLDLVWRAAVAQPRYDLSFFKRARCKDTM
jgi:hypothetical protein